MAPNNNRKGPACWFDQLAMNDPEYLESGKLTEKKVRNNITRLLDDIINGRIDYNVFGKWVLYPPVLNTLLGYCNNQLLINQAILYSLNYTLQQVTLGNIRCDIGVRSNSMWSDDLSKDEPYTASTNMITEPMRKNMAIATENINKEVRKFLYLSHYVGAVFTTRNVYELQNIPTLIREYYKYNN